VGQPEEEPGFIEEALRHRQVSPAGDTAPDEVEPDGESVPEPEPEPLPEPDPEPGPVQAFAAWPVGDRALVDEALKKAGLIWLHSAGSPGGRPYWHVWLDESIYLLTGGSEQPAGGLETGEEVTVAVASKETHARLLSLRAIVSELEPTDSDWESASTALAAARLNLSDVPGAPARWAADSAIRIYRVVPSSPDGERPGAYPSESGRAAPRPTPATTTGKKPRVLHRRHGSGRPLS
jgi:hypothetical protein